MHTLLRRGRVIDPASGSDAVADVLLRDGEVAAVGADLEVPDGCEVVDVTGLVVGPGFVDLHSHAHSIAGQRLQALDGVTTALDLEAGLMPIARAYADAAAEGRPLNYGFSASWAMARSQAHLGVAPDARLEAAMVHFADPAWQRSSSPAEQRTWLSLLERDLGEGALGIGVLLGYAPHSDPREFLAVSELAVRANTPVYSHVRELVEADPTTPVDGSEELVRAAAETGAHMHHCHVNSTSRRHVDRVLALLDRARREGSRITVETYPYGAGGTGIGSYFLAPERLSIWGIAPSNLIMVATGERVADATRLRQLRASDPAAECIIEFLDEDDPGDRALLRQSLAFPDAIVASDALPVFWAHGVMESRDWPLPPGGSTHPRTAGTFTRALRLMVRETATWSWLEAFRRCSLLPARVLDATAPGARAKGHLGVGADADIVVLDPDRVSDAATFTDSTRPSVGVRHLFVAGVAVVRDGELQTDAYPGRPLRGEP